MPYTENYNSNVPTALEGMIADTGPATILSRTVETTALGFGKAVKLGTKDHTVDPVAAGTTAIYGISVRSQATRVTPAQDQYPVNDTAAILVRGAIWVKVAAAVVPGDDVTVTVATGAFGTAAVGAGVVAIPNAFYETAAQANGLARVRIN